MPVVTHRPAPPTVSPAEAGEYVGLAEPTLRNMRSQQRGPAYIRCGRRVRYKLSDLDAWLRISVKTTSRFGPRLPLIGA